MSPAGIFTRVALALSLATGLSACGDTTGEQALFGAGAGAVTAAAVNGNVATGAAIGLAANLLYCSDNPSSC